MILNLSLALHVIGIVMWTGSLIVASRIIALGAKNANDNSATWLKKIFYGWTLSGLVLVTITGLYQLMVGGGPGVYFKQGWFHGKITLVIVLYVVTFLFAQFLNQKQKKPSTAMMIHGLTGLCLILITLLTFLGR